MTYRGRRDPPIELWVPQTACKPYINRKSEEMIEIQIPPEQTTQYETEEWGSIMVKTKQLCFVPNQPYNILYINACTKITNSVKNDRHKPLYTEYLTPEILIGRWLKWYAYLGCKQKNKPLPTYASSIYYQFWKKSGLRQDVYIRKLLETDTNL